MRAILYVGRVVASVFFVKQKTAYDLRISDWSSDVCSSDLLILRVKKELESYLTDNTHSWSLQSDGRYIRNTPTGNQNARSAQATLLERLGSPLQIGRASCRERVCQSCRSRWSSYP